MSGFEIVAGQYSPILCHECGGYSIHADDSGLSVCLPCQDRIERWACVMLGVGRDGRVHWRVERSYPIKQYADELADHWNAMGHTVMAWVVVPYGWTTEAMAA
jgi:hypothetical protein